MATVTNHLKKNTLRIGISQRHRVSAPMAFAHDALESAWHGWFATHWSAVQFVAIPNFGDAAMTQNFIAAWGLNAFILSGGGDAGGPVERVVTESAVLAHAREFHLPVMGICRGMQFLHQASGGKLVRVYHHVDAIHSVITASSRAQVNSWHEFGIDTLAPDWQGLATAEDGSFEAIQHGELPWFGVMWHPERPQGDTPELWAWIHSNFKSSHQDPSAP